MISISRRDAGRFRAALKRCVVGRPRDLAPQVFVDIARDETTLFAAVGEVAIALALPGALGPNGRHVLEFATLCAMEKVGVAAACEVRPRSLPSSVKGIVVASSRTMDDASASVSSPWPIPGEWRSANSDLLQALHECSKSAADQSVRYALSRLQIRGAAGELIGTDGRQLLIWGGFRFPFDDDLLTPAVPVFGSRDFASETEIRSGRTDAYFVIEIGPWTIWLTIDATGRFPDVHRAIPRLPQEFLNIGEQDRMALLDCLARWPVGDEETALTLSMGPRPAVRQRTPGGKDPVEFPLLHSSCSAAAMTLVLNRNHFQRALALGLCDLHPTDAQTPVIFRDERRTYVTTTLDAHSAVPESRGSSTPLARIPAAIADGNPARPTSARAKASPEQPFEGVDCLTEAEGLRGAVGDVVRRAARLVLSLRQLRKHRRVLENAWTVLKNLRPGP